MVGAGVPQPRFPAAVPVPSVDPVAVGPVGSVGPVTPVVIVVPVAPVGTGSSASALSRIAPTAPPTTSAATTIATTSQTREPPLPCGGPGVRGGMGAVGSDCGAGGCMGSPDTWHVVSPVLGGVRRPGRLPQFALQRPGAVGLHPHALHT